MDAKVSWKQRLSLMALLPVVSLYRSVPAQKWVGTMTDFRPMELSLDRPGRLHRNGCDIDLDEEEAGNPVL